MREVQARAAASNLTYEDAEREAIELEAWEADHRVAVEAQDAKHWRAGRAMGVLAAPVSKIEAERRRTRP